MVGVRLGRPHILRSVTPWAATASLPLLGALLLAGTPGSAAENPSGRPQGQESPAASVAQADADPFAEPGESAPIEPEGAPEQPASPEVPATQVEPDAQEEPATPAPCHPNGPGRPPGHQ